MLQVWPRGAMSKHRCKEREVEASIGGSGQLWDGGGEYQVSTGESPFLCEEVGLVYGALPESGWRTAALVHIYRNHSYHTLYSHLMFEMHLPVPMGRKLIQVSVWA